MNPANTPEHVEKLNIVSAFHTTFDIDVHNIFAGIFARSPPDFRSVPKSAIQRTQALIHIE